MVMRIARSTASENTHALRHARYSLVYRSLGTDRPVPNLQTDAGGPPPGTPRSSLVPGDRSIPSPLAAEPLPQRRPARPILAPRCSGVLQRSGPSYRRGFVDAHLSGSRAERVAPRTAGQSLVNVDHSFDFLSVFRIHANRASADAIPRMSSFRACCSWVPDG